jgi:cyanate lyase
MPQSEVTQSRRSELTATILDVKARKNLSFLDLTEGTGLSVAFVTAALLGQHPLPAKAAEAVGKHLELDADSIQLLQRFPCAAASQTASPPIPRSIGSTKSSEIYGTTLKVLVHEQFGDGIISAINFRLDIKKVEDPEGGSRAVITLDGKFLPNRPY